MDNTATLTRSAKVFLSGTFLSRVTGMFRDVSMAFCFGTHPAIAAFMVAFRFSHLFRRLFGESALSSSFIPHFETARSVSSEKGMKLFKELSISLFIFLTTLILFCEAGLFCLFKFGGCSEGANEVLLFSLWMLPGVLFICLFALNASLLQCEKKFFLSSAAPALFNLVWVAAVFLLCMQTPEKAALYLSVVVTVAFFIQWLSTVPSTWKYLKLKTDKLDFFSPELRGVIGSFSLAILGVGAGQINSALDALFARAASLEAPAYLWYAVRMQQLPLALFGIALSSALLPPLARAIQANDMGKYREFLGFSLKKGFSLMMPCTFATMVLGVASVNLLYGRGHFTEVSITETILCLWGYAVSLVPYSFVLLFAPAFYARKKYAIPTLASLFSVIVNCALNALFVFGFGWGAFSIAMATSIAALFNFFFLAHFLAKQVGSLFPKEVITSFLKTTVCAVVSGGVTLILGHFLIQDSTLSLFFGGQAILPHTFFAQLLHFFVLTGVFFLVFFSYAWLLNLEEILDLFGLRRRLTDTR